MCGGKRLISCQHSPPPRTTATRRNSRQAAPRTRGLQCTGHGTCGAAWGCGQGGGPRSTRGIAGEAASLPASAPAVTQGTSHHRARLSTNLHLGPRPTWFLSAHPVPTCKAGPPPRYPRPHSHTHAHRHLPARGLSSITRGAFWFSCRSARYAADGLSCSGPALVSGS